MSRAGDSRGGERRRIDDDVKGGYVEALRRGLSLKDSAKAVGFGATALWQARKRDPAFAEAVEAALDHANTPRLVCRSARRKWQLRRPGNLRFVPWRQELFLQHFAGTCDQQAACEAAGVSVRTVDRHRLTDPVFAAQYQTVLDQAYVRLEAEALRQRLAAQKRIAEALEKGIEPLGEMAQEFERVMKLLARWDRKQGGPGHRFVGHGRQQRWSFDDAIDEIERGLRHLGAPIRDTEEGDRKAGDDETDGDGGEEKT